VLPPSAPPPPTQQATFQLVPFAGEQHPSPLQLQGRLQRTHGQLLLIYRLEGDLNALQLPKPATLRERRDRLWTSTCLECFLALPGDPGYWELNLSPAGHWNLYRLSDYRQDLRAEPVAAPPRLRRQQRSGGLQLELELELPEALATAPRLELAVSAVIAAAGGSLSHWALVHAGDRPDFHRRDSFLLSLEEFAEQPLASQD
jgi:hypothetical protein